jgi:hypothetical protein
MRTQSSLLALGMMALSGLLGYAAASGEFFRNPRRTKGRGQPQLAGLLILARRMPFPL